MKTSLDYTRLARAAAWAGAALAALASTLPAQAQGAPASSARNAGSDAGLNGYSLLPYTRSGYVGINVGRSDFNTSCGVGPDACNNSDASVSVYTGGLLNEWLGAEVGYVNTGKADRAGGSSRGQGVSLKGVLRAPIGPFNAFLKGGALYGETRVSTSVLSGVTPGNRRGWGATYGAGLGFDFTPSQGVVLEWTRNQFVFQGSGRQDVDTTSVGYVYRF